MLSEISQSETSTILFHSCMEFSGQNKITDKIETDS